MHWLLTGTWYAFVLNDFGCLAFYGLWSWLARGR